MGPTRFDAQYFRKQYRGRLWRRAGVKPVLDRSRLRWLRRWVAKGNMVDVGSGYGHFARRAASQYTVYGIDLSPDIVREAFAASPVHGIAASAYQIPLDRGSMDLVVSFDVVEHLADPSAFFAEAFRVLRPGGFLYFSTPNPRSFGARIKGPDSFIFRDATHCSVLAADDWRALAVAAGFSEAWQGTDTLWDPPYSRWFPRKLQWAAFLTASQLAWTIAPAFRWRWGENIVWLGQRK